MFTGIIQEIGTIALLRRENGNINLGIDSHGLASEVKAGDSISISGVCITATAADSSSSLISVTAVQETLAKSTLGELREGSRVNLELALKASDRLGGHFVQGHVDCVGVCTSAQKLEGSWLIRFEFPKQYASLVVEKGSIAVDGVSLTAIEVNDVSFSVSVIPHTWQSTTLGQLKPGSRVNLEFDLLAKYVRKMMFSQLANNLTLEKLAQYGY